MYIVAGLYNAGWKSQAAETIDIPSIIRSLIDVSISDTLVHLSIHIIQQSFAEVHMLRSIMVPRGSPVMRMLWALFFVMAVVRVLFAVYHLWTILTVGYDPIKAGDFIFNLVAAAMAYLCFRLIADRKFLVLPVFGVMVALVLIYNAAVGRGLNLAFIGISLFFLAGLDLMRRRHEFTA